MADNPSVTGSYPGRVQSLHGEINTIYYLVIQVSVKRTKEAGVGLPIIKMQHVSLPRYPPLKELWTF